jgi:uncharacterized membrane-anchored protein YitT (DUF2179 family)
MRCSSRSAFCRRRRGSRGFLLSSGVIDGGVTGVSMLLSKDTRVPLAILLPAINLPFVALGMHQMGTAFAIRSATGYRGFGGMSGREREILYCDVTRLEIGK